MLSDSLMWVELSIQRGRLNPEHRHFGTVTPEPNTNATPAPEASLRRAQTDP
jgi:hypothetical protein